VVERNLKLLQDVVEEDLELSAGVLAFRVCYREGLSNSLVSAVNVANVDPQVVGPDSRDILKQSCSVFLQIYCI